MKPESFLHSSLLPLWIGHPVHFGPHAFFPDREFEVFWRFLRCNKCRFRQIYLCFVRDEFRCVPTRREYGSFHNARPLHDLTRAIKTVLHGLSLNRHSNTTLVLQSSCQNLVKSSGCFSTSISASIDLQHPNFMCPSHGRELFTLLYCEQNDNDSTDTNSSWLYQFIPRENSFFYRTTSATDDDDDEVSPTHTDSPLVHVISLSSHVWSIFDGNCGQKHPKDASSDLLFPYVEGSSRSILNEVNSKWNSFYSMNNATPTDIVEGKRTVRFPSTGPVSKVHRLVTYADACRLERLDRTWETAARYRVFDHYRQLLCMGYNPDTASELAVTFSEDEECRPKVAENSAPELSSEIQGSSGPKKSRRKRKRRGHQRQNHLSSMSGSASSSLISQQIQPSHLCSVEFNVTVR